MKIESKFNEIEHKKIASKYFKISWKPILKNYLKVFFVSLLPVLLGIIMIYGKNNLGAIFISFGVFWIINVYTNYKNYLNHKKNYFNNLQSNIEEYKKSGASIFIEYDNEYFHYSDFKQSFKTKWEYFGKSILIDDYYIFEFKQNLSGVFFVKKDKDLENHIKQISI